MKELQLEIISPEKRLFSGKVTSVNLPGIAGSFGILADHAPLVSPLQAGTIVYTTGDNEESVEVKGGIVEVNQNVVTICVS